MAAKIFSGLRRALSGAAGAQTAPEEPRPVGVWPPPSPDFLERGQVILAARELSGDDPEAARLAASVLNGTMTDDTVPFLDQIDISLPLAAIGHALNQTGRIATLDWRATTDEAYAAFSAIFDKAGLIWPAHVEEHVNEWIDNADLDVSQSVALVYYALRSEARAVGFEILQLNDDSNSFHFLLATRAAADRWRNVMLGEMVWIENPDWQFRSIFKKNGWEILYPEHPSDNPATPPSA